MIKNHLQEFPDGFTLAGQVTSSMKMGELPHLLPHDFRRTSASANPGDNPHAAIVGPVADSRWISRSSANDRKSEPAASPRLPEWPFSALHSSSFYEALGSTASGA